MNIIGIDPSLSHTAAWGPQFGRAIRTKPGDFAHSIARLAHIRGELCDWLSRQGTPGTAYIEGYAFGASCRREVLGELGGVLRLALWEAGWRVCVVPPTTLKKFVTGTGRCEKSMMIREVWRLWEHEAADDNDADAYALRRLGLVHSGAEQATKARMDVLAKLTFLEAK